MTAYCDLCGSEFDADAGSLGWCDCVGGPVPLVDSPGVRHR